MSALEFAIPSNDVKFMLQQVLQEGKPRLGWIGVRLQTVTPRMAGALGNQVQGGAIVSEVAPNSPGSEVGLRVGDVVQSVDNRRKSQTAERSIAPSYLPLAKPFSLEFGATEKHETCRWR